MVPNLFKNLGKPYGYKSHPQNKSSSKLPTSLSLSIYEVVSNWKEYPNKTQNVMVTVPYKGGGVVIEITDWWGNPKDYGFKVIKWIGKYIVPTFTKEKLVLKRL